MSGIDTVIDGLDRISLAAQLRDKVFYALEASKPRCGACQHWLKSRECPAETNVNGISRGPDAGGRPCHKFQVTSGSIALAQKRIGEAVEFATVHRLPLPSSLAARDFTQTQAATVRAERREKNGND